MEENPKYILNNDTHVLHKWNFDGCPNSKSLINNSLKFDDADTVIAYRSPGYVLCEKCFKKAICNAERIKKQ